MNIFKHTICRCLLAALALACMSMPVEGQSRHFIIATDVAYTNADFRDYLCSDDMRRVLQTVLKRNHFGKNDYISFVSYAISGANPKFEGNGFVRIANDARQSPLAWRQFENAAEVMNAMNFASVMIWQHLGAVTGAPSSLQSFAKQYVMKRLGEQEGSTAVDETLLLMITDEKANGDDYRTEYSNVMTTPSSNTMEFRRQKKEVEEFMSLCNKKLQFVVTPIFNTKGDRTRDLELLPNTALKIVPYVVLPATRPAIQSITNVPSPLPIRRVRGGYLLNLDAKTINDEYEIQALRLTVNGKTFHSDSGLWRQEIESSQLGDGDSLTLEMDVRYKDGIYNGLLISSADEEHRQGMTLTTRFSLPDEAKIMGVIPLVDALWWWFPNDAFTAVLLWDLLLILAFIAFICWCGYLLFRRLTRFVPENSRISLVMPSTAKAEQTTRNSNTTTKTNKER